MTVFETIEMRSCAHFQNIYIVKYSINMLSKVIFSSKNDEMLPELLGYHPRLYDFKHTLYKDQT